MVPSRASSTPSSSTGLTVAIVATAASSLLIVAAAISLFSSARRFRVKALELERRLEEVVAELGDGGGGDANLSRELIRQRDASKPTDKSPKIDEGAASRDDDAIVVRPIGTVTSPYPQRAGCPRQGLLAPHSRSHLVLSPDIPFEITDGLELYSHVWVVFRFHLNPVPKARCAKNGGRVRKRNGRGNMSSSRTWPTKIRPPRAGGIKMGVLATRSPHRPNELGVSVGLLEGVEVQKYFDKYVGKSRTRLVVKLLGLDLVDGTPVLDVKPYVPWDGVTCITRDMKLDRRHIVSSTDEGGGNSDSNADANELNQPVDDSKSGGAPAGVLKKLLVPPWVAADDELGSVSWTGDARKGVRMARENGELSPLYPPGTRQGKGSASYVGDGGGSDAKDEDEVCQAIEEVVAQDPRSLYEGRGMRAGSFNNSDGEPTPYEITFCTLRISFHVVSSSSSLKISSDDGNNRPVALIISARPDPGDPDASPGSYQRNLYLRRSAEAEETSKRVGRPGKLKWARPLREGDNEERALELEGGKVWKISATS